MHAVCAETWPYIPRLRDEGLKFYRICFAVLQRNEPWICLLSHKLQAFRLYGMLFSATVHSSLHKHLGIAEQEDVQMGTSVVFSSEPEYDPLLAWTANDNWDVVVVVCRWILLWSY